MPNIDFDIRDEYSNDSVLNLLVFSNEEDYSVKEYFNHHDKTGVNINNHPVNDPLIASVIEYYYKNTKKLEMSNQNLRDQILNEHLMLKSASSEYKANTIYCVIIASINISISLITIVVGLFYLGKHVSSMISRQSNHLIA